MFDKQIDTVSYGDGFTTVHLKVIWYSSQTYHKLRLNAPLSIIRWSFFSKNENEANAQFLFEKMCQFFV